MSEWTPGEWLLIDKTVYALDEQGKVNRFSVLLNGGHVNSGSRHAFGDAVVRTTDAELAANAHLIAAAPDLYEALRRLEKNGHTQATWDLALKAMAKARGEEQ